jgi:hypothetical protein
MSDSFLAVFLGSKTGARAQARFAHEPAAKLFKNHPHFTLFPGG